MQGTFPVTSKKYQNHLDILVNPTKEIHFLSPHQELMKTILILNNTCHFIIVNILQGKLETAIHVIGKSSRCCICLGNTQFFH